MKSQELGFFLTKRKRKKSCPTHDMENDYFVGTQNSIYFTVDEGKGGLNPSRDKNQGKHRSRRKEKSCVTFLLSDPGRCGASTSLTSRINGMTTHTQHILPQNRGKKHTTNVPYTKYIGFGIGVDRRMIMT